MSMVNNARTRTNNVGAGFIRPNAVGLSINLELGRYERMGTERMGTVTF
ncbi:MAG: hypothetical protein H7Y41_05550 [Hyphomonadaceae bacterium]|nr:hypothetical protein [Clostridia bacterium]